MKNVKIFHHKDDLMNSLAELICEVSEKAIAEHDQFNFVLSGGGSPKTLYELLASDKFNDKIEWSKTYFFFGDERFVPENDDQRNSLMAQQSLFEPLNIPTSHIFKVDTTSSPDKSAQRYMESIKQHFKNQTIEFDFVLLGLGDDAHTASLFPNTSVLDSSEANIAANFVKDMDTYRITMTAPLIHQAKNIVFLVFGENKADAVYHVLKQKDASSKEYPAILIQNNKNKPVWYLDEAAAARL